ncbi:SP_1767 family glycosyltransferase [uncultured Lactobacillus sp.]|uniref:SP_1767 family glycosyltransferase n=1 Tax=uncultured Lactobacillus sp. TaxID=153152 RepID=UPI00262B5966|nr:SP_1767 family glycosyltransferase [uncultured Lactobacillus sp.]
MNIIALSGNYGYLDKIETTIKSILWHNKNVEIHVINPDIPHEWFINLNQYANQFGVSIIDEKIDPQRLADMKPSYAHINQMAYGRFLIPQLIKDDKVLYLDSDIVVDDNIEDIFDVDLGDKMLYAVRDYHATDQFNSGVMLINNKKWREEEITQKLIDMGKQHLPNGDQTVINEIFRDQMGDLDPAYNYQIGFEKDAFWNNFDSVFAYFEEVQHPKIIHYVSGDKPFNLVSSGSMRDKWWHYRNLQWSDIVDKYVKFDSSKLGKLHFKAQAFLFTRVAETQDVEELIKRLPNVQFNIAAYTPMAFLLLGLTKYDNVHLFPSIIGTTLTRLIDTCDLYLDINYGGKEYQVLHRITPRNVPMFSFEATKSQNLDYDNYHVFQNGQVDAMATAIEDYIKNNQNKVNKPLFNIDVKDTGESLDLIAKDHKSVVRFGDGEFDLINGKSIPYQQYDENLSKHLKNIVLRGNYNNTLVCLPDVFRDLDRYGHYAQGFYEVSFFPDNEAILTDIEKTGNWYGSTFISRPYIDLIDKSKSQHYFDKWKEIWNGHDLLIVEGKFTRSGVGNDLFDNANSVERIICPPRDSYAKVNEIEDAIKEHAADKLVLLMLGPTAKVIVDDLQDLDNQIIDLGHIDSEYEWFKMGAKYKVKLKDKHTAEFNYDENIEPIQDAKYQEEIVARID